MKRTLLLAAVMVTYAGGAGAATLTVTADKPDYNIGWTITLTVVGTNTGEASSAIYGRLLFEAALTDNPGLATQNQHTSSSGPAILGSLHGGDGFQAAFDQILDPSGNPVTVNENTVSTVKLIANAPGIVHVTWRQGVGDTLGVEYFDISSYHGTNFQNAVGTTFCICNVPEPTSAALLGLGLLGLTLSRRRRA